MTEEHLMIQVKNGELDSLAPLFEQYHIKLYNFFLRLTRDGEVSRDLTQNVFKRVLLYRQSYNEGNKFRSWLYQIARNIHLDYYNSKKLFLSEYGEEEKLVYDGTSADEELEADERRCSLREALQRLEPEQRELIELSRFQELKYKEIAEITGNSVSAIKVKIHRAINKLRKHYFEHA